MINIEESERWMMLEDYKFRATLIQCRMELGISGADFGQTVLGDPDLAARVENLGIDPTLSELRRYAVGLGVQVLHAVHVREIVPAAELPDAVEVDPPVAEQTPAVLTESIEPAQDSEESSDA